jgi:transglutaminase-like putative cysteine protease
MEVREAWLTPTWFIDSDSEDVERFASDAVGGATDPTEMAIRLFRAVRDGVRYDPYRCEEARESYRASSVVRSDANWCVPKSVLLTATARNRGIPARLGFADVRNHLNSEKLRKQMGSDLFIWHGFSELLLGERWFKLSTAFNIELCERFGTRVLDFDGSGDALMHPYDASGRRHMEYVRQRGSYDDLPLERIQTDFASFYPDWFIDERGVPRRAGSAGETRDEAFAG